MEGEWPTITNIVLLFCMCIVLLFNYFRNQERKSMIDYVSDLYQMSEIKKDFLNKENVRLKALLKGYGHDD